MASTDDKARSAAPSTPTPAKPASKAAGTPAPDWERIELDYRAGVKTLRQIAAEHGVTHAYIAKRAKANGWERDLAEKIRQKAEQLVTKAAVTKTVTTKTRADEREVIEANGHAMADVLLSHRRDIQRSKSIVMRLLEELEPQVGPDNAALLADLGDMLRSPDESGQDKLNDLYRKIISLPERAKTAKTLAETLRIAVDMERQAFGMDAKGADGATPGAAGYVPPSIRVVHVTAPVRQEDDDAGD